MKSRRKFLKTSVLGLVTVTIAPNLSFVRQANVKGIVKQPADGETYYVRENTPITIKISKKGDHVESMSLCTEEIPVSKGISTHKHLHEDEFFIFHKGVGIFAIGEEQFNVSPGSTGIVPKDTWHNFQNTGSEPAFFLWLYPGWI